MGDIMHTGHIYIGDAIKDLRGPLNKIVENQEKIIQQNEELHKALNIIGKELSIQNGKRWS